MVSFKWFVKKIFSYEKKKEFFISYLDSSFHRVPVSTTNNHKRQLPDIPTAQLNANREKGIIGI
jgi:hypothetical protein